MTGGKPVDFIRDRKSGSRTGLIAQTKVHASVATARRTRNHVLARGHIAHTHDTTCPPITADSATHRIQRA